MKSLSNLIPDIHKVLTGEIEVTEEQIERFALQLSKTISNSLNKREPDKNLRMSKMGEPSRKLWYSVNQPEKAEKFEDKTLLKFLYGNIIEDLVLFLAEAAGHTVEDRQKEVEIAGVKGHIDAKIDGVLIDAKSASSFQFQKFKNGTIAHDDQFGYISQLSSYLQACQKDENLQVKGEAFFLAINKEDGSLCLTPVKRQHDPLEKKYEDLKALVKGPKPERCFEDMPEGKSGNRKLGTRCSYCAFKQDCWADANHGKGLQTYIYSKGPVFLTQVSKEPNVGRF